MMRVGTKCAAILCMNAITNQITIKKPLISTQRVGLLSSKQDVLNDPESLSLLKRRMLAAAASKDLNLFDSLFRQYNAALSGQN